MIARLSNKNVLLFFLQFLYPKCPAKISSWNADNISAFNASGTTNFSINYWLLGGPMKYSVSSIGVNCELTNNKCCADSNLSVISAFSRKSIILRHNLYSSWSSLYRNLQPVHSSDLLLQLNNHYFLKDHLHWMSFSRSILDFVVVFLED